MRVATTGSPAATASNMRQAVGLAGGGEGEQVGRPPAATARRRRWPSSCHSGSLGEPRKPGPVGALAGYPTDRLRARQGLDEQMQRLVRVQPADGEDDHYICGTPSASGPPLGA